MYCKFKVMQVIFYILLIRSFLPQVISQTNNSDDLFNQFLLAEYLVRQTMAARGHMNGWPAVGGTGWSAQRGSLPHQIFRYGNNSKIE